MLAVFNAIWQCVAEPGNWWTGEQRVAIALAAREATVRPLWDRQREDVHALSQQTTAGNLSPLALDTIERIATESGQLNMDWCQAVCRHLGEGAYIELLAVVVLTLPVDRFCRLLDREPVDFPTPTPGQPARSERDDLVDIGGWTRVTQTSLNDKELVNVSRALSQAERENVLRRELVDALYMMGHSFFAFTWDRHALSRPQLELAAVRTSMINACFYCAQGHAAILDLTGKHSTDKVELDGLLNDERSGTGITHGELILDYTELANREPDNAYTLFPQLVETLGEAGAVELAATIAAFNGLNRTSDPTGMPMESTIMSYARLNSAGLFARIRDFAGVSNSTPKTWIGSVIALVGFRIRRLFSESQ